MDALDKLRTVSEHMSLEPAEEFQAPASRAFDQRGTCGHSPRELRRLADEYAPYTAPALSDDKKRALGVSYAAMPGGKRIALLKKLLTSACERNCFYCPFRAGRDFRRVTFKPDEMAQAFLNLHRAQVVEGLFLSSGIINGGARMQDKLIAVAEVLRFKLGFKGYIHLKIMPGAERAQVERAMQLADRLSINLEAPNAQRLTALAPLKAFYEELVQPLRWVEEIRRTQPADRSWNGRWPSTTTQFVVGAADESDLELLSTTEALHKQVRLARAYFSAFHPVPDTPLENQPAENPWREFRLYQSSFLLRDYGFTLEELPFNSSGNLPLEIDPKAAWAQRHLVESPVEINRADRQALLRVPGIGPKSADAIVSARRAGKLSTLRDLKRLGINIERAAPYILLDGRRQATHHQLARQLTLW
ncbi:MAG: helix-hairpin-helix domain-containing protein [Anaerolineae bacterium]|nr:helix-hairpin-helix domain-containing protein [Thermoflexales bacterium]MDW8406752.1 helix-hairpin-helix domain-containing protein [Anaerolineae bacterium]